MNAVDEITPRPAAPVARAGEEPAPALPAAPQDATAAADSTRPAAAAARPAAADDVSGLRRQSEACRRRGAFAEALDHARQALGRDGEDAETFFLLAAIHLQNLDLPAARKAATAAVDRNPAHVAAMLQLSEIALRQGNVSEAHRWADRAIADGSSNQAAAFLARAHAHLAVDEYHHARVALEAGLGLAPDNALIRARLDYVAGEMTHRG